MLSCEKGHTDFVKKVLERGDVDVNVKYNDGRSAIMMTTKNGHTETVAMLLEKGADVNAKDIFGKTILMEASSRGHTEIVALLIKKGADVNAKDIFGNTVLMEASSMGHTEIVSLIKKHMMILTALIIKKGLTQKGNKPLMPFAHRETIHRIASFF